MLSKVLSPPVLSMDYEGTSHLKPKKVSGVSVPQEYDLVRLLKDVENSHSTWTTTTPACKWSGINCNAAGIIQVIDWRSYGLRGSLDWQYLPNQLIWLILRKNKLTGEVPFKSLPSTLVCLSLQNNRFSGNPCFKSLPLLKSVSLSNNQFEGWVDFDSLPNSLKDLYLSGNSKLRGSYVLPSNFGMNSHRTYDFTDTEIKTCNGILRRNVMWM